MEETLFIMSGAKFPKPSNKCIEWLKKVVNKWMMKTKKMDQVIMNNLRIATNSKWDKIKVNIKIKKDIRSAKLSKKTTFQFNMVRTLLNHQDTPILLRKSTMVTRIKCAAPAIIHPNFTRYNFLHKSIK